MAPAPSDAAAAPAGFPRRAGLEQHEELHARPALPVRSPCAVAYWIQHGMTAEQADVALRTLSQALGLPPAQAETRHARIQGPGWMLKYERHGEFVSWQINRPLSAADDPRCSALEALPPAFLAALQAPDAGALLAATQLQLIDARGDDEALATHRAELAASEPADDRRPLMGGFIADGQGAAVLTTLQLGGDGFTRFRVLDFGLPPDQLAREAQRLCEIEAYRMLAMLGFPLAQAESRGLGQLEQRLQATVDAMVNDDPHDDDDAFAALTRLAAEIEHAAARSRYRLSATRAYHAIVRQRLADLREQRIAGVQTLGGFLSRRFAPAMAFCESTEYRLGELGERIGRALSLARVRIEARREQGNQELLRALAERQQQQLRLQQTVEGLSVLAISYYGLGLIGYAAKGLHQLPGAPDWLPSPEQITGLGVIPVLLIVVFGLRRLHRA